MTIPSNTNTFAFTTFEGALKDLDRGRFDALERVLQSVASRYDVDRDDVWSVVADLHRYLEDGETDTLAGWLRRVRGWLSGAAGRAALLKAKGLRRADVHQARKTDTTAQAAREARAVEAQSLWFGPRRENAAEAKAPMRDDMRLLVRLLVTLGVDPAERSSHAFLMQAIGADPGEITATLGIDADVVASAAGAGRAAVFGCLSPNAAFALRRVLGEDNDDLAASSGLAAAAVRMRVSRGLAELRSRVQGLDECALTRAA